MKSSRIGFVLIVVVLFGVIYGLDLHQFLSLSVVIQQKEYLQGLVDQSPYVAGFTFLCAYILVTALSIPGALILTVSAGAFFGLFWGVMIASVGSTSGATLSFLGSRFLVRSWVETHFPQQIKAINQGLKKEGVSYLFALRLIPIFPFFLINLAMGITRIKIRTYVWVSQLGMLAGTFVFVNAGRELSKIESLSDVTSLGLITSFILLGVFPLISKRLLSVWKQARALKSYPKPKKFDRNLIVIGAGAGGLVSSYIAATVKAKVTLVEKHKMGGDCLNTGCVPSKALIKSSKVASEIHRAGELGIQTGPVSIDFDKVMQSVRKAVSQVEPHDSIERYTQLGVECLKGEAKVISPYSVDIEGTVLTTRSIIVATGARPHIPNYLGLDKIPYYTSDTIWGLQQLPKRLLIVGAGPIACELAQAFSRLGAGVVLLARSSRVMKKEDEDVSDFVMKALIESGVDLKMQYDILEFSKGKVCCDFRGELLEVAFDEVLLALGRDANTQGFGLCELGIELNENGSIKTDEYLKTSIPTIYACGDVVGPYQFTHMAAHQAWYASVNAMFGWVKKFKVDYSIVPWVTYVDPEVARVGVNEQQAREQQLSFEVTRFDISELDRAITENSAQGFIKVVTAQNKDRILGVTIVGQNAGEILAEFVLAMKKGIGLNGILSTTHAYPTMAEANKYVAGEWKKNHSPIKVIALIEKLLTWRRG